MADSIGYQLKTSHELMVRHAGEWENKGFILEGITKITCNPR